MTQETLRVAYNINSRMFEKLFAASKKVFDSGHRKLANVLYQQACNHRSAMRRTISHPVTDVTFQLNSNQGM